MLDDSEISRRWSEEKLPTSEVGSQMLTVLIAIDGVAIADSSEGAGDWVFSTVVVLFRLWWYH